MAIKNTICLLYGGTSLDAATFHVNTFPDAKVLAVHYAPGEYPAGRNVPEAGPRTSGAFRGRSRHALIKYSFSDVEWIAVCQLSAGNSLTSCFRDADTIVQVNGRQNGRAVDSRRIAFVAACPLKSSQQTSRRHCKKSSRKNQSICPVCPLKVR